jgi:hypothetical protein
MNQSITSNRYTGLPEVILSALLLWGITWVVPYFFKAWFVEPSGNIKIMPMFGLPLGLFLLFRLPWAWRGAWFVSMALVLLLLAGVITQPEKPGYWLLMVMNAFLLYLLQTERTKSYFTR